MKLELASNGANVVIESDDSTVINVLFRDGSTESIISFNYVSIDIFDLIDGVKSCLAPYKLDEFMQYQRVRHEEYGIGTVICMSDNGYYGVAFDDQIGRLHNCKSEIIIWGQRGVNSNCWWVRKYDITTVEKPKLHEPKDFCVRFLRYMEEKEREVKKI